MQKSESLLTKKLKKELKKYLKTEEIVDIILIGSSVKEKLSPSDIDLIVLFREKNRGFIEQTIYSIRKNGYHAEALVIDDIFKEKIFISALTEGISLKNGDLRKNSMLLFSFSLQNLDKVEKVRFSQALNGRNKDGLLQEYNGVYLGRGCFAVPVSSEYLFRELMMKFNAKYTVKKILIIN